MTEKKLVLRINSARRERSRSPQRTLSHKDRRRSRSPPSKQRPVGSEATSTPVEIKLLTPLQLGPQTLDILRPFSTTYGSRLVTTPDPWFDAQAHKTFNEQLVKCHCQRPASIRKGPSYGCYLLAKEGKARCDWKMPLARRVMPRSAAHKYIIRCFCGSQITTAMVTSSSSTSGEQEHMISFRHDLCGFVLFEDDLDELFTNYHCPFLLDASKIILPLNKRD